MTIFVLLAFMLVGGLFFLILPTSQKADKESLLTIKKHLTNEIKAIVLFVADLKQDEPLEELLAYKVLSHLKSGINKENLKHVWLLHSDISSGNGSSYSSAAQLSKKFKSEKLKIHTYVIEDVFDANTIFPVVRRILRSENFGVSSKNVVCDCTAGTKFVTLGIALASFGNARLIYFPSGGANDASEYIEIDTRVFIESLNVR